MRNNTRIKKGRKPYNLGKITLSDIDIAANAHIRMRGIENFIMWCNDEKHLKVSRWTYYRAWYVETNDTPLLSTI
ncbi:MAG: hypothetical protein ACRC78_04185, partial [Planktothrix sp.]